MTPSLPNLLPKQARQRFSRWLLLLVVCWQALLMLMPVAQAKAAAGEGGWESICTMQGSVQVWVDGDSVDEEPSTVAQGHCPLCLMSQTGIAPPASFNIKIHRTTGTEVGQLVFTSFYLTRAWSAPATGPPATL
ncbi:MAG: DUF2946 family protein [Fluviibacter sp.]